MLSFSEIFTPTDFPYANCIKYMNQTDKDVSKK